MSHAPEDRRATAVASGSTTCSAKAWRITPGKVLTARHAASASRAPGTSAVALKSSTSVAW
jgi:hypothetical protein